MYLQRSGRRMRGNPLSASPGDPLVLIVDPPMLLLVFQIESSHSLLPGRGALARSLKGLWGKYLELCVWFPWVCFCSMWWVVKARASCQQILKLCCCLAPESLGHLTWLPHQPGR